MEKVKNLIKRKWVYIPLIIVVLIVAGIGIKASQSTIDYKTVTASRGDFIQVISATGKVVPAKNVDMAFETGGRVGRVNVKVGDQVKQGQTLASLGGGDAYASLLGAQARLETEQIKLRDLEAGTRPEETSIKQTALTAAQTAEKQTKDSLKRAIIDSYITSDDLIKNKINQFFYQSPADTKADIHSNDYYFKISLDKRKEDLDNLLIRWGKSINNLSTSEYAQQYYDEALANVTLMRDFLSDVSIAVSQFIPSYATPQTTLDKYKSDISTARATINDQISLLTTGLDALKNADLSIKAAQDNLDLSKAGANPFDIETQRAIVKSAEANLLGAQVEVNKNLISAPFDGVITKVNVTAGENASIGTPSISLISVANFEVESFIPEADIAKIHLKDNAKVTLDAYGGETFFDAVITQIEPAETIVESVSTYKTTFQFIKQDERIKSGMTANIDIQGQIRHNILSVPQSAVLYDNNNKKTLFILKTGQKKPEERSVRTGQTDDKGNIEVIDGVTEGEKVVTNPPRK